MVLSMSDEELKKALDEYKRRNGRNDAIGALTKSGLSPSFAERAVDGRLKAKKFQRRTRDLLHKALCLKAS